MCDNKNKKMKQNIAIWAIILCCSVTIAQTTIPLENYFRNLKSVKVQIEGKTYDFLFDTGGGITIISPKIVQEINGTAYGNSVGFRMSGEKVETKLCDNIEVKIAGISFFHPQVGVFDLMNLLPEEFDRIDGLISLKTFHDRKITMDLVESQLILETEESFDARIKDKSLVKSRFANGPNGSELNIFIGIPRKQRAWWFLFDTGNIAETKIAENTAMEWEIRNSQHGLGGKEDFSFKLNERTITTPTIIDKIIYDGALSFDFISQSEYSISLKTQEVWMN